MTLTLAPLIASPRMSMRDIAAEVAAEYGMTVADLKRRSRCHWISHTRQEAMRRMFDAGYSLPQIGRLFGLDHTTVLHGVRAARAR